MKIIKCTRCGTRYDKDNNYCPFCGSIESEIKNKEKRNVILSIVLSILTIIVGCTVLFVPWFKDKYEQYKDYIAEINILTTSTNTSTDISPVPLDIEKQGSYCYSIFDVPFYERTPELSDAEASDKAKECFENEDYEELAKLYMHRFLDLPEEATTIAFNYSNIIIVRDYYNLLSERAKNKDLDIKYEAGSMLYFAAQSYTDANDCMKHQDKKYYELYEHIMEEARYYISDVCGLDENELHFWTLCNNDLLMDYYSNKVLLKLYKDLYNQTFPDTEVQKTLMTIKTKADECYNAKDYDMLSDYMEIPELADEKPYYKVIADCYKDINIADRHYNVITQEKPDDIHSDIDMMVFFCTVVVNKGRRIDDIKQQDSNSAEYHNIVLGYVETACKYLYSEFGYTKDEVEELLLLTEWSGETWEHYLNIAEKNIREKYYK